MRDAHLAGRAAWVPVPGEERDPQRFWISVADALRGTRPGSALVRPLTAAPDLDGWAIVERLLKDLAALEDRVWLVVDDVHELRSAEALSQLELLVMRAPPELRFVLSGRHDLHLGLHRLRLEGELTEIRAADLRFTLDEARALFKAVGVKLSESALARLHARTEGWAAGLRLAALSLAGHPDPEQFAAEFSGSERTVAEYLLAEVLERQSEQAKRLLLRTSVCERVCGELADLLTGGSGGERVLRELEAAGAFVVSLDAQRSWFRYHALFADVLQLELRSTARGELPGLHGAAAGWFAEHGYPVEAVRHAQAAENWALAARLLSEHWLGLVLNGQAVTVRELLTGFPPAVLAGNPELSGVTAGVELNDGSLGEAKRHLALAERGTPSVPAERRPRFEVTLAVLRLQIARQHGDLPGVAGETERLLAAADAQEAVQLRLGEELRVLALISQGIADLWSTRFEDAERHLDQGIALARRINRPYLELTCLAYRTPAAMHRSSALAAKCGMRAVEVAERHGWSEEPIVGVAYTYLGGAMLAHGRLEEADRWLGRAEPVLHADMESASTVMLRYYRGVLELVTGRYQEALAAFRTADRLCGLLVTQSVPRKFLFSEMIRAHVLYTLAKMGQTERGEESLAEMDESERQGEHMAIAVAVLRLAQHDPQAATVALARVFDSPVPGRLPRNTLYWNVEALLLTAITRDALGDADGAARALERALELAEPDGMLLPFLLHPAPRLLEFHRRHRSAHAVLISQILNMLAGRRRPAARSGRPQPLLEPLTRSETRVLRYLPTNLTAPEIAGQLGLSVNTVMTHMRHLYAKLGAHRRHEAIDRARALGLLAPSSHRP
jgi:LuxR family maltose regulon positive regulatory protein